MKDGNIIFKWNDASILTEDDDIEFFDESNEEHQYTSAYKTPEVEYSHDFPNSTDANTDNDDSTYTPSDVSDDSFSTYSTSTNEKSSVTSESKERSLHNQQSQSTFLFPDIPCKTEQNEPTDVPIVLDDTVDDKLTVLP